MIRVYILKNHYISNEMPLSIHQRLYFWVENFFENLYNLSCILPIWLYMTFRLGEWEWSFVIGH